jgi:hypothetical protein
MRSAPVRIAKIIRKTPTQVRLIDDDYVVQALATDLANDTRTGCGKDLFNAHRSDEILEVDTI